MEEKINICKVMGTMGIQCNECMFYPECKDSFQIYRTKEYWLEILGDRYEQIAKTMLAVLKYEENK